MRRYLIGLSAAATLTPCALAAQPAPQRSEIPIREVILSDGMRRYTIPITVGGTKIEAGLDSGSSGLRILPGVLGEPDAKASTRTSVYSYGSGARLNGMVGEANVTIGAASGATTIEMIKTVDCVPQIPKCPALRVSLKDYGIQGNGLKGEGFKAIIGVNMADAEIKTPLSAIGARRWIIELPLPNTRKPGRLILNPTPEETAGFITFKIDPTFSRQAGGMHDAIGACLLNTSTEKGFCGPALLDTGDPGLTILNGTGAAWPNDTPAAIVFQDAGKSKTAVRLAIGRREFASRMTILDKPDEGVRLHLGIAPYFAYAVLYDPAAGVVSLKPRSDSPMQIQ